VKFAVLLGDRYLSSQGDTSSAVDLLADATIADIWSEPISWKVGFGTRSTTQSEYNESGYPLRPDL